MITKKLALLSIVPLFCAGLAVAQAPDLTSPPPEIRHHPDHAAMHKEMCEDHLAKTAAKMAYVEAKLGLTDAQKPLFAKWRLAVIDSAGKQKTACLAEAQPKGPPAMPTVLEREARAETMLQSRLQMLQSTKPSLVAFYDSLNDAQKDNFNHMHEGHMRGRGMMGHGGDEGGEGPMHRPQ